MVVHRRHSSQQRLGWLPLLCLQGIFQLLPEALGQPSHLPHQDQLSLPLLGHQEPRYHHPQLLTLDLPHLGYPHHQQHCHHHHSCLQIPQSHLLHPIIKLPAVQHQPPYPTRHLHLPAIDHHQEQPPLSVPAFPPLHLLRVCVHRLVSLWRTMRLSSMHHHHNDLMTTTPPSEPKFQGIVSSQTQRLAELTSRSSQGLMQWSSAAEHLESSVFSGRQPSSGHGIKGRHLRRQAELT